MLNELSKLFVASLLSTGFMPAAALQVRQLEKPVEVLRDRWGTPHIYAATAHDLFFSQGYITAMDRLFQIDLWRRVGTGKLAEVLGPSAIERDKLARAVNFRGDWNAEWAAYGPDVKPIVTAFTDGINAYIRSLGSKYPLEFRLAGYDPGLWAPEDCLSRVAGLGVTRNLIKEVSHAEDIHRFGMDQALRFLHLEPSIPLAVPHGLDLDGITSAVIATYREMIGPVNLTSEQGSNNWVVDGTMTATGRPILASDPHRPVQLPSLRKTVHLIGPGWNVIGAGEPALPGIALGHNKTIAFGFTIVGIDPQDLYVESTNPRNPNQYLSCGKWVPFDIVEQKLLVRGRGFETVTLRYTLHGPVIYEDSTRHRAYALRWVGSEPGTAGYIAGLSLARAKNWSEFSVGTSRYRVPSENLIYADVDGNIGWQVSGLTPIREGWSGLLPVPGAEGRYEWNGFQNWRDLPSEYNPARHYIATANNNILPAGYTVPLGYEWTPPFRVSRIREMLSGARKFTPEDFERMQTDVGSLPARRFQQLLRGWYPEPGTRDAEVVRDLLAWDAQLRADSRAALIYEVWMSELSAELFGKAAAEVDGEILLAEIAKRAGPSMLQRTLDAAWMKINQRLGQNQADWKWGKLHQLTLRYPLGKREFSLGPIARPGDAYTVNATSGTDFKQTAGASWRMILDVGDWDRSVMTNAPGESGDPQSKHYADLLPDWAADRYHPMPYSRKAVEAATEERIVLHP